MEVKAYNDIINAVMNSVYEFTEIIIKAHNHFVRSRIKSYIYTIPVSTIPLKGYKDPRQIVDEF